MRTLGWLILWGAGSVGLIAWLRSNSEWSEEPVIITTDERTLMGIAVAVAVGAVVAIIRRMVRRG